jgi:CDP-glucose 4,6-dehydratase
MADLVMETSGWRGRRVLVTGHTGFKGAWLSLWLHEAGAHVSGFALPPASEPSSYSQFAIARRVDSRLGDIRDVDAVRGVLRSVRPEVVFHLAAQPIVRISYDDPIGTLNTNIMGTAHVLEAAREVEVGAMIVVTSDKVYRNLGHGRAFREDDQLGGHDPYSMSKAAAELITALYRDAYRLPVVSVRAGNVIGGGDRSPDRIVPDVVRAWSNNERVRLRNPDATRPWQHVADALSGYVTVAQRMLLGASSIAEAYNFGPPASDQRPVRELVERLISGLGGRVAVEIGARDTTKPEAPTLALDSSRAQSDLGWRQQYNFESAVAATARWYRAAAAGEDVVPLTLQQLAGEGACL